MKVRSLECKLLENTERLVRAHVRRHPLDLAQEARFELLEAVASRLGGFDLEGYRQQFNIIGLQPTAVALDAARPVVQAIGASGIPDSLAVSALAREALGESDKRSSGAYHTDFRLALHLARCLAPNLRSCAAVVDPACGAGMLLTALMWESCGGDRQLAAEWLSKSVHAADLSANALRGTLLSLACLVDDLDALRTMRSRWIHGDSLIVKDEIWSRLAPGGFDAVIANPPWEKLKLTRHEYMRANGHGRHYGHGSYDDLDIDQYSREVSAAKSYARKIGAQYHSASRGEVDLFVAFSALTNKLLRRGGEAALLVPAGLIRSQNTEVLRRDLAERATHLSIQIFENRARFFEIDTRFKFLAVHWRVRSGDERASPIHLQHGTADPSGVQLSAPVHIGRAKLARLRRDFSLPEIRSDAEWHLFCRMIDAGVDWSDPDCRWHPQFMREVDMSRDREHFTSTDSDRVLPLVEGRMVHQHRFGAKGYVEGTGRSAAWSTIPPGDSQVRPQFYIDPELLSPYVRRRCARVRAGFCDITGQTNERSCLAAIIPAGVVCGNKVPTILFPRDPGEERLWLWVAIANSLPFDWLLRRVITTTVNYFHLLSLALPSIEPDSLPGRELVRIAKRLNELDAAGASTGAAREMALLRGAADHIVSKAYGLTDEDVELILADFPLLDRAQPPIGHESRSTVTADLLMTHARDKDRARQAKHRFTAASELGAVAYLASQTATETNRNLNRAVYA